MKYTQIPTNTFKNIQLNAGVLLSSFNPETESMKNADILGATSGGINFTATPTYVDFGSDIDNCPKNTKELKKLDTWEAKMSGTFATVTADLAMLLLGAADGTLDGKAIPRPDLDAEVFSDIWWVGDYSDINADDDTEGTKKAGFVAIHMMNALSTGGFQIQSSDKDKGKFSFEFTAHYSMDEQETVPFEIYVKAGTSTAA